MADAILDALLGEQVVHANPIATVTRNCLVIRDDNRRTQTVLAIQSIRELRKVNTTNIALLAIAAGLFTIAAAAYSSHQGYQISLVIAALACLFLLGYFSTRRATVVCLLDDQSIESRSGSYRQVRSIIRAVEEANQAAL